MPSLNIEELIEDTLRLEVLAGTLNRPFPPHQVPWRTTDFLVMVHTPRERYMLEFRNGSVITAKDGEIILIPPGTSHRLRFPRAGILSGLHIRPTFLGGADVLSYFVVPHLVRDGKAQELAEMQAALTRAFFVKKESSFEQMAGRKAMGFRLLERILQISKRREGTGLRLEKMVRLKPVLDFVDSNLHRRITRDELAKHAHFSRARFHTVFQETMGIAPMEYVRRQRLQRAIRLLQDDTLAIGQVAERLGYSDSFHFSHQFKAMMGTGPLSYRRQMARDAIFPVEKPREEG